MDMCKVIILSDHIICHFPPPFEHPCGRSTEWGKSLHDKRGGRKWKTIFAKYSYDIVLSLSCKFGNDWSTLFLLYTGWLVG